MDILYPYNETLPKQSAHDVYLVRNCASLEAAGLPVKLLCGWGSSGGHALCKHYQIPTHSSLQIQTAPILRKFGPISCNRLFFWAAQRTIQKSRPAWVLTSVFKQAEYHVKRRCAGSSYGYEVHQLSWYPTADTPARRCSAQWERSILERMNLVTTTTEALRQILLNPPYSLTVPVHVIPLAVDSSPLPPTDSPSPFTLMYIGQLYASQGVNLLLQALQRVPKMHLEVIGGSSTDVGKLRTTCTELSIADRVTLHGFRAPGELPQIARRAHAFVAPFLPVERMPYVAHTKLLEYASWERPVVAPRLEVVREHFTDLEDSLLFTPGDPSSLAQCLERLLTKRYPAPSYNYSWQQRAQQYRAILERYR